MMMNFLSQNNFNLDFFVFTYSNLSSLLLHSIDVNFMLKIFSVLAILTIIFLVYKKEIEFKFNFIHISKRAIDKIVKGIAVTSGLATIYMGGKEVSKDLKNVINNNNGSNKGNCSSSNSNKGSSSSNGK
jgi:hypothetical protein